MPYSLGAVKADKNTQNIIPNATPKYPQIKINTKNIARKLYKILFLATDNDFNFNENIGISEINKYENTGINTTITHSGSSNGIDPVV